MPAHRDFPPRLMSAPVAAHYLNVSESFLRTLRYLTSTTNSAGVIYYYLRRKGSKVPLGKGPTDSPAFLARYAV